VVSIKGGSGIKFLFLGNGKRKKNEGAMKRFSNYKKWAKVPLQENKIGLPIFFIELTYGK
jgi:hypothetical protein